MYEDDHLEMAYEGANGADVEPDGEGGDCPNPRCTGWHWCGDDDCPIDCGEFDCEQCTDAPG